MAPIELANEHIVVRLDPERGATIDHLGVTGAAIDNVLAHYDWKSPLPARLGPGYGSSTADWLSEYRGGWQLLTPSGGAESIFNGVVRPFHGEVSRARWTVVSNSVDAATLTTGTHGPLEVSRTLRLDATRSSVVVKTTIKNGSPVPAHAILIEHIAFAGGDNSRVFAPSRTKWRYDPSSPEGKNNDRILDWADSGIASPVSRGKYRLASLLSESEGWVELHNGSRSSPTVRIEWDPRVLPYLWQWQERGSECFPWYGRADITALEPSSVSFSDGLLAAVDRGEAWFVGPGEERSVEVSVGLIPFREEKGTAA